MKKFVIQIYLTKKGVKHLLNWKHWHFTRPPKFIADGWNGKEPLYYDGGQYYFKCFHQDINCAKLFNTKQAAEHKVDMIYWNTNKLDECIVKKARIIEVEVDVKESGEYDEFDLEKRFFEENPDGHKHIQIVVKPDLCLSVNNS